MQLFSKQVSTTIVEFTYRHEVKSFSNSVRDSSPLEFCKDPHITQLETFVQGAGGNGGRRAAQSHY